MAGDLETAALLVGLGNVSDETIIALTGCSQVALDELRSGAPADPDQETLAPIPADPAPVPAPQSKPDQEFRTEVLAEWERPAPGVQGGMVDGAGRLLSAPSVPFECCQYPSGEAGKPDFYFCAAPAKDGSSYCAEHHALCHTAVRSWAERKAWNTSYRARGKAGGRLSKTGYANPDDLYV